MNRPLLTFCSGAINHLKNMIATNNSKSVFIGVKGGGCNGLAYDVRPTNEKPQKNDETLKVDNTNIIVCGRSIVYLVGTHVHWENNNLGSGLKFDNPNINSQCGCGSTFSI